MAAKVCLLSLSLSFLLLFNGCTATGTSRQTMGTGQQQQRLNECQIHRLSALEPNDRVQAEAGETQFWDSSNQQFQCAGVSVIRHRVQPRGLLLPSYLNSPLLAYVEQGNGISGVVLPGCPSTFQSSQQFSREGREEEEGEGGEGGGRRGERFQDRHQKISHFRQGDVVAIPAGAAHWLYNDGQNELIVVVLLDTSNNQNQLDRNHRRFFLAGNPQQYHQWQGQGQSRRHRAEQTQSSGNILSGFDVQVIAEAFNVDTDTARRIQGQDDQRGHIIMIERGLQVIRPPMVSREERQGAGYSANGMEETVCTARLRHNIDNPELADFYNPQAGRCTSLNSFKFPILSMLQLSVERGVLHRNAMVAPHWIMNAHSIVYVTRGSMQMQIVNNRGEAVFDDQLSEGQLVVVPQNFAVVKRAREDGCRWVSFRTNDNAMINTLAGRNSALQAMPVDVIANAFQISREQAQRLKLSREEAVLFTPSSRSGMRTEA